MCERLSGFIRSWHFSESGNFCFIEDAAHVRYFLHCTQIKNRLAPTPGSIVSFVIEPCPSGAKGKAKYPRAIEALITRPYTPLDILSVKDLGGAR
jgi:hypothetical protein